MPPFGLDNTAVSSCIKSFTSDEVIVIATRSSVAAPFLEAKCAVTSADPVTFAPKKSEDF